jgi:hypothetical protein
MTGPFDRLRAWVGSFFGAGTTEVEDGDGDGDGPASEASTERIVHRDDRPLETPSTMERPDPPTPGAEDERVDIPDAEGEASDDTPVSIPDAESGADVTPTAPTDESADEQVGSTATAPDATGGDRDESGDAAFTCSVCGTTVDDPSEPCPLCRSTDVVPTSERDDDSEAPTRGGRTSASTGDDEAVDRLRDVEDEG